MGVAGGVGEEQGDGEDKGNVDKGNVKESDTAWPFVSFSPKKEAEER